MMGLSFLYFIFAIKRENKLFELKETKIPVVETESEPVLIEHEDIENEAKRVNSNPNDPVLLKNLIKIYPNGFQAIKGVTFGVKRGEVFGLLGPNGAGKSTTFGIMSALIPKTDGDVLLDSKEISRDLYDIFFNTGICLQQNSLWDDINVEQHIRIYARMKGIKGSDVKIWEDYLIDGLYLREFAKRKAVQLSGGNKRKLCVALTLLGAPEKYFLDEPTTGVDPISRMHMWELLKASMQKSNTSMVLTTHYMQEAESMSDRICILINGQMSVIGSLTELRNKFGEYTIQINLSNENQKNESNVVKLTGQEEKNGKKSEKIEKIEKLIKSNIKDAVKTKSSSSNILNYTVIPENMNFAKAFDLLNEAKSTQLIEDFSIYTTTLDQIFVKLAAYQRRFTQG